MRRGSIDALACLLSFAFIHVPFAAESATKKAPEKFTTAEFKNVVAQASSGAGGGFGADRGVATGAIGGVNGAYFDRFANATVGLASGPVSMMDIVDVTESNGAKFNPSSYSKDVPGSENLILAATCTKDGKREFLGFVKFADQTTKVSHLFWVGGTGAGISDSAGQSAVDRIFDRLKSNYMNMK
jgi:hypothetical protein